MQALLRHAGVEITSVGKRDLPKRPSRLHAGAAKFPAAVREDRGKLRTSGSASSLRLPSSLPTPARAAPFFRRSCRPPLLRSVKVPLSLRSTPEVERPSPLSFRARHPAWNPTRGSKSLAENSNAVSGCGSGTAPTLALATPLPPPAFASAEASTYVQRSVPPSFTLHCIGRLHTNQAQYCRRGDEQLFPRRALRSARTLPQPVASVASFTSQPLRLPANSPRRPRSTCVVPARVIDGVST